MTSRKWCFTKHGKTVDELILWGNIFLTEIKFTYCIWQIELAPTTGAPHIQGYAITPTPIRMSGVKKLLSDDVHIEIARGTNEQNITYCSKAESRAPNTLTYTIGTPPVGAGARTDLTEIRQIIKDTGSMRKVVEVASGYQAMKAAEMILKYSEPVRNWKPEVTWIYGKTGSGKTKLALETLINPWISGRDLKWWEGYDAHEDVLIDDFRADFCTFHELLRILDRTPYRLEVKGSSRQLLAKRIWITSCYPPDKVYQTREDIGQLLRRIDTIHQL